MKKYKATICRALLLASSLFGIFGNALAGQKATWICIAPYGDGECARYELRVKITSDEDAGQVGAYGIGVWLSNGSLAYWTVAGGFEPYNGGLVHPVEGIGVLPVSREYLLFSGSVEELCALSGGRSLEVYAGRGVIPQNKLEQLNWLLSQNIPLPADHIRGAYIYQDVSNSPWKVSKVFSWSC